ncbi:MAG: YgjP-like metallopeptidase domain-containing protein, partial [Minisyncoccia bacterium]
MLDIKFIREHRDVVKKAAIKKHIEIDIDKLIQLDDQRLDILRELESLRAEQNNQSKKIQTMDGDERQQAIIIVKTIKEKIKTLVHLYEQNLGVKAKDVKIMELQNRWASCTKSGNINF